MTLSQFVDRENLSTNGEQLEVDEDGLPGFVFVFCQTALTVIFFVLWKFIIYREIMKQSFNYMQLACYFCNEIQLLTFRICQQFLHLHSACFLHFLAILPSHFSGNSAHDLSLNEVIPLCTDYTGCNRRNGLDFGRVFLMLY